MEKFQSLADVLGVSDPVQPDKPATAFNASATRKDFCKQILDSPEYRQSLMQRIVLGMLPPAIEQLLYYYADGKPVEHLKVIDDSSIVDLTPEQVAEKLQRVQRMLLMIQASREQRDAEDEHLSQASVH